VTTPAPWSEPASAEISPHASWVFDIERERMVWANAAGCELWAAPDLEELQGRDFSTDMSDATRARLAAYLQSFERGEVVRELWTFYPGGVPRVVRLQCSGARLPDGRLGLLATQIPGEADPGALRAVEALRHSNAVITLWHPEHDRPLLESPAALRIHGPCTGWGQVAERFVDPEVAEAIRRCVKTREPWSGAARVRTKSGERWHQVEVRPTVDPVTGDPAMLVHEEDIHRVKGVEEQLRESHATLERRVRERTAELELRERIASVGMLAAGVAHELNNPLTFVSSNIEQLVEALGDGSSAPLRGAEPLEMLEECLSGTRRMATIIHELASFARPIQDDAAHVVDLAGLLRSSMRLAAPEVRHRARLLEDLDPKMAGRGADERLGQVFLNLIVNGAQAIPPGAAPANHVRVRGRMDGETAVVEIEDTGSGVPEDLRARIFEPFFTTKAVGANSGLGLFVCQRIVGEVGGSIDLTPSSGGGTSACVRVPTLPLAPPEPLVPEVATKGRRLRILLVDDEPDIRRTLTRVLGDHDVVAVESGRAALEWLERGERFDGVLCDLGMSETTGMDVFRVIASRYPELRDKALFMTGGAFTPEMSAFVEAHRDRILAKPISRGTLTRAVEARFGGSVGSRG
jgi:signal transduction histidine kinase/CheY-like chemotaxis protein